MLRAVRNLAVPIGFTLLAPAAHAGRIELLSKAGAESDTAISTSSALVNLHPPSVSADGRWTAFSSAAVNLVAGQIDRDGYRDVFLHDRQTGSTVLVSRSVGSAAGSAAAGGSTAVIAAAGGSSEPASISDDGRWVVYESGADNLVAGQVANPSDSQVFLYDRETGVNTLVSHSAAGPAVSPNGYAGAARISGDGNWIVFASTATDLLPGQSDTPDIADVFLYERATGQTNLVSRAAGTATATVAGAQDASISANGRYVVFRSSAANLVSGQTSGPGSPKTNVFVHDRATRRMELISRSTLSPLRTSDGHALKPILSPNGRYVAFLSQATDLAPGATGRDVFLADRQLHTLERVAEGTGVYFNPSYPAPHAIPLVSANGNLVLFTSGGPDLAPGDFNGADDVFAYVRK